MIWYLLEFSTQFSNYICSVELKKSSIFWWIQSNPIFLQSPIFSIRSIRYLLFCKTEFTRTWVVQTLTFWLFKSSLRTTDLFNGKADIMSCEVKFSALFIFLEQATRLISEVLTKFKAVRIFINLTIQWPIFFTADAIQFDTVLIPSTDSIPGSFQLYCSAS